MRSVRYRSTFCAGAWVTAVTAACVSTSTPTAWVANGLSGPTFPGAGLGGQNLPIVAGFTPDSCTVAGTAANFDGGTMQVGGGYRQTCYYGSSSSSVPMAFLEQVVETAQGMGLVHVRLTMNPAFVDNTYGSTAIGWGGSSDGGSTAGPASAPPPSPATGPGGPARTGTAPPSPGPAVGGMPAPPPRNGHVFRDLYESDHAQFILTDATGATVLSFNLDYISPSMSAISGFATLGVSGGDGNMITGDARAIVFSSTSLDRDLNACGYSSFTTNSPATDSNYTPNSASPNWDYRVVYDVWVSQSAFGAGFGTATIPYVHASPSKTSATVPVKPGPCPTPPGGTGGGCVGEGCFTGGSSSGRNSGASDGAAPPSCVGEVCEDGGFSCLLNGAPCMSSSQCCSGLCVSGMCVTPTLL